jgi:integral membrane sensor domain MASE1
MGGKRLELINIIRSGRPKHVIATALATGVLYYFGVQLALTFVNPVEKIAFFWPSNAIAAAVLIFAPRRVWPAILCAVVAGYMAARGPAGGLPLSVLSGFCLANLFECTIVALIFGAVWKRDLRFADMPKFLIFLLMACVVAAVLSGVIGGLVVAHILHGATFLRAFVVWFTGDLCGLMMGLPILVAFMAPNDGAPRLTAHLENPRNGVAVALALLAAAGGLYLWLSDQSNIWLFTPYLVLAGLVWVALELNLIWTVIGAFAAGVIEVVATFVGFGLFAYEGMSITDEVVLMKAAIAVMTMAVLSFAARCEVAREEKSLRAERG